MVWTVLMVCVDGMDVWICLKCVWGVWFDSLLGTCFKYYVVD